MQVGKAAEPGAEGGGEFESKPCASFRADFPNGVFNILEKKSMTLQFRSILKWYSPLYDFRNFFCHVTGLYV